MTRIFRSFGMGLLAVALAGVAMAPGAAQSAEPKSTVTVGLAANVNTLDPHRTATVGTDLSVISQLYSPLIVRGPDMKLKPALAKSWHAVDDLTWRFDLVPDVTFANGEKMDAAAVKWNIERLLDPNQKTRLQAWFGALKEARVIDPTTVELVTKKPFPALAYQLSMLFMLPPKWSEQHNPAVEAMGTGPYDLVEFLSGDHLELRAKESYWGEKPKFEKVVYRIVPEASTRVAALLAGEIDLITGFPPTEIKRINDSGRAEAGAVASTRNMFIRFNTKKPPFKGNPKLRLALNYAIDKKAIVESLWTGFGSVSDCNALSKSYFGYNPDLKPIPYDPAKAKRLLADAGYPNGLDVDLEVPLGRYLQAPDIAQIVAAQLGDIGVRVKLVEEEFGVWIKKAYQGGQSHMAYLGFAWPTLDADGMLQLWTKDNPNSYWENETFTTIVNEAGSTTDEAKRLQLYKKATEIMCEDSPNLWMFFQPITWAQSKSVDWQKRGDDWFRATDILPR